MENKLIVVWGAEPRAGCKTLARALTAQLADWNRKALLVSVNRPARTLDTASLRQDPAAWIARFKSLSPVLLRNYLASPQASYAQLALERLPAAPVLKELLALLRNAFEWTLWLAPVDWSADSLTILDAADLLMWVARPSETSQANLRQHFERLASLHYANAFSQIILNQLPPSLYSLNESVEVLPGRAALCSIPQELPRGPAFRQGVQRLLDALQKRQDLYASKGGARPMDNNANQAVEDIKNRLQPQLMQALEHVEKSQAGTVAAPASEVAQKTLETCLAQDADIAGSREERAQIYTRVLEEVLGLGPIEPLLKDPEVTEVMVNGRGSVFVEKKGKLHATGARFSSDGQLRTIIDRIVAPIGRRVDESMPLCDARLADGSRVNIVLPPLSIDGAALTIRKFMAKGIGFPELVQWHSIGEAMAAFLRSCVLLRKNIVVAGGTGSGKTTLLNALSGMIPDDERIVTIEDAAELRLQKPHVVRLESRPANAEGEGAIPIRRLVINALRMRPDRIVVGECRGGEALDMLQAMNTGHDGSLTTLHANSPRDALRRLETLVLMAGMDLPIRVVREQIQSAVHILIQQSRMGDGSRKVVSITEVTGMEGDTLTTQELFHFRPAGKAADGCIQGAFESTGLMPSFSQEITPLALAI